MSDVAHRPACDEARARDVAADVFGLEVVDVRELDSERDRNFALRCADGSRFVLKVHNAAEDPSAIDCQDRALETLHAAGIVGCPRPVGRATHRLFADDQPVLVRLLTWVEGRPFARVRPHTRCVLEKLGRFVAAVTEGLGALDAPWLHRDFHWNLADADAVVEARLDLVPEVSRRRLLEGFLARWRAHVQPDIGSLRSGAIHGDANDYNVLATASLESGVEITGLIDFGDMVHGPLVADAAIAAAYAMLDKRDPLGALCAVIRGYDATRRLDDDDLAVVFELACARLCQSVALAAEQRSLAPDNEYLGITEAPAWAALSRLAAVPARFARARVRAACGREAVPEAAPLRNWIERNCVGGVAVVEGSAFSFVAVDFGVGSVEPTTLIPAGDETRRAIGRYGEVRAVRREDGFVVPRDPHDELRTVHLGVDVFARVGAEVRAPLAGVVETVRGHVNPHDFGWTVTLRHDVDAGTFWSLWGHLDLTGQQELARGSRVEAGQAFAKIAGREDNGGWPPHVHVQLVVDRLDLESSFPGLAAPSEREFWMSICPDPSPLLGFASIPPAEQISRVDAILEKRRELVNPSLSVS